jgi:hypothetical protein
VLILGYVFPGNFVEVSLPFQLTLTVHKLRRQPEDVVLCDTQGFLRTQETRLQVNNGGFDPLATVSARDNCWPVSFQLTVNSRVLVFCALLGRYLVIGFAPFDSAYA